MNKQIIRLGVRNIVLVMLKSFIATILNSTT